MLGLGFFPQRKVGGVVFLLLAVKFTCGVEYIVQVAAGKYAVVVVFIVFVYVKVDAALALVCVAVVQNLLYKFYLWIG